MLLCSNMLTVIVFNYFSIKKIFELQLKILYSRFRSDLDIVKPRYMHVKYYRQFYIISSNILFNNKWLNSLLSFKQIGSNYILKSHDQFDCGDTKNGTVIMFSHSIFYILWKYVLFILLMDVSIYIQHNYCWLNCDT